MIWWLHMTNLPQKAIILSFFIMVINGKSSDWFILLFFSFFFFFLFQNTLPCVSSYRQAKVRECRGFTPQLFPVTGPYVGVVWAVCLWSQIWFRTSLYLVWSSWELLWVCGGNLWTEDYFLCWRRHGVKSCREDCQRNRASSPSFNLHSGDQ